MANLIAELGADYFNSRFAGSFFKYEDKAHIVQRASNDAVESVRVNGTAAKPLIENVQVPAEHFVDMTAFAVPAIGWRSANNGRYMAYYSRVNRSYRRGVSIENLTRSVSPLTEWLADNGSISLSYYARDSTVAKLIVEPEFYSFAEGMKLLREGKVAAFCISEHLAVFPESEEFLSVMFNNTKVGTVDLSGKITCNIPFITALGEQE